MKFSGLLLMLIMLLFGCNQPKPQHQLPNINWTPLDEPPLFLDCPTEDANENWQCFSQNLQQQLADKLIPLSDSFASGRDTLFISLKVDTIGQISVLGLSRGGSNKMRELFLPIVTQTVKQLPRAQPAFKTNLEIPVEVSWTLPVCVSK